jgi:hypothetical protein
MFGKEENVPFTSNVERKKVRKTTRTERSHLNPDDAGKQKEKKENATVIPVILDCHAGPRLSVRFHVQNVHISGQRRKE